MAAPSLIVPRLYLSNVFSAKSQNLLTELHITHIISVVESAPKLPSAISSSIKRLHIPIADDGDIYILEHLTTTTTFIKDALEENETNAVLVRFTYTNM